MSTTEIIKIYSAKDRMEAEMVVELLKQNGIPALLQGVENSGFMDIYAGNSICGEDIYVNIMDGDKARDLIYHMFGENPLKD